MARLAHLAVQITAENAQLRRKLAETERSVRRFGRSSRQEAGAVEAAFLRLGPALLSGLSVGALAGATRAAVAYGDAVAKTADKIGLSTAALQEMRYAAERSGVSHNTLDMAMQRFSRRLGEAVQGGGELRGTLQQYGVALRDADGKTRTMEAVLGDLADAIAGAGSEQEQLRIAFKAFDSEGAALVNLLRDGSGGMDALRGRARSLGLVLEDPLLRRTEELNDRWTDLTALWETRTRRALLGMADAAGTLYDRLRALGEEGLRGALGAMEGGQVSTVLPLSRPAHGGELPLGAGHGPSVQTTPYTHRPGDAAFPGALAGLRRELDAPSADLWQSRLGGGGSDIEAAVRGELMLFEQRQAEIRAGLDTEAGWWEQHYRDRYEIQSRSLDAELELNRQRLDESVAAGEKMGDAWQAFEEGKVEADRRANEQITAQQEALREGLERYSAVFAQTLANTLVYARSFADAMDALWKSMVASLIASTIEWALNYVINALVQTKAEAAKQSAAVAGYASQTYAAAFASTVGFLGPAAAGYATGMTATMVGGAVGSYAPAYAAMLGVSGVAHGGLDSVPRETTMLLDRGERVIKRSQNEDLTAFLAEQRGAGGAAGPTTVVLEVDGREWARGQADLSRSGRLAARLRS